MKKLIALIIIIASVGLLQCDAQSIKDWSVETFSPITQEDGNMVLRKFERLLKAEYKDKSQTMSEANNKAFSEWSYWVRASYDFSEAVKTGVRWSGFGGALSLTISYRDTDKQILKCIKNKIQ